MIYTIPFIAALIGWFTNFIAVKMLFHPKKPIKILFFTVQGIFPKRQNLLAEKLGDVVANDLFSMDDIAAQIKNVDKSGTLAVVDSKLDNYIENKLPEAMPMISMFLSEDMKRKIKATLLEEIEIILPDVIESYTSKLTESIDIKGTVSEKVANFSTDKLEDILYSIMKKEFKFIEILGAVLGFIIGLVQIFIVSF